MRHAWERPGYEASWNFNYDSPNLINIGNYRSYASGLPAQITASLTIGLTGMPFSGSDIG